MKRWLQDDLFRAILRNAGWLLSSKGVGVVLGLAAIAAAGKGLGVREFGILTLIHAYALAANSLVQFQSWQFVIRYGAPAVQEGDRNVLRKVVSLALGLDFTSGTIGMLLAMAALPFLGPIFGIGQDQIWLAILYCTLLPTMASASPTGVLRLLDRFDLLSVQAILTPAIRAGGAVTAWALGAPFWAYLLAWYLADLLGDLSLWALAIRELKRRDYLAGVRPRLRSAAQGLDGAWRFVWAANVNAALGANWSALSNLVVGAILGPAAAGLYRVALTVLDSAGKPADLLSRAFYPEIARLHAASPGDRRLWVLTLRSSALGLGVALLLLIVAALFGRALILAWMGAEFEPAYEALVLMIGGLVFTMTGFPLESVLYTFGRARSAVAARGTATLIYLPTLALLAHLYGLRGAGAAYIVGAAALVATSGVATLRAARLARAGL